MHRRGRNANPWYSYIPRQFLRERPAQGSNRDKGLLLELPWIFSLPSRRTDRTLTAAQPSILAVRCSKIMSCCCVWTFISLSTGVLVPLPLTPPLLTPTSLPPPHFSPSLISPIVSVDVNRLHHTVLVSSSFCVLAVVEAFFLNDKDQYLEVELCP